MAAALQEMVPPILDADSLGRLRRRGLRIVEHTLAPGGQYDIDFPRDIDVRESSSLSIGDRPIAAE